MANNIIKRTWNQNRMVNIDDLTGFVFQNEAGGHTFEISGIDDSGAAVSLSGTVAGVFRRADNADIALTGSASGGVVSVTLTDDCYAVPGRFGFTIFVTSGGQKVAVYAAVGTVSVTSGGGVAGDTPQDVVDLINAISAAVATIPASYTDLMAAIAPTYSPSALYPVGFYVWHDGHLYRCTTPITTAETWTAAHWTAAVLGDDIGDLKSALNVNLGNEPISFTKNYYITTSPAIDSTISLTPVNDVDYSYAMVDCTAGDIFTVNGSGGWSPRLWAFIDSENKMIAHADGNATGNKLEIIAPANSAKCIINYKNSSTNPYAFKGQLIATKLNGIGDNAVAIATESQAVNVWSKKRKITQGTSVPASEHLIDCYIPSGTKFTVEIVDRNGSSVIAGYSVYANGTNLQNPRYVNTVYYHTATENITYFSIYVTSANAVGTGYVDFVVKAVSAVDDAVKASNLAGLKFELGSFTSGSYIGKASGGTAPNPNYSYSGYIDIHGIYKIGVVCTFGGDACLAFYDSSKTYIPHPVVKTSENYGDIIIAEVPDNAAYFRTSYYSLSNAYPNVFVYDIGYSIVKAKEELEKTYCDYEGKEICVFNKILCIGDSLTKGTFNYRESGTTNHYVEYTKYSYPTILTKLTGIETTNKGKGGYTSVQWYASEQDSDLSGYDMAIIQLGVNDVGTYSTWGQDSIDAFTAIINKLKSQNNNIKIFVANIIPATSYSSSSYTAFSAAMLSWLNTTYASDPNVIPLDMQQYGHTADDAAYNCGHLSALGYSRLAQDYVGYISYYISKNKTEFSEVQFIGTNYQYHE